MGGVQQGAEVADLIAHREDLTGHGFRAAMNDAGIAHRTGGELFRIIAAVGDKRRFVFGSIKNLEQIFV